MDDLEYKVHAYGLGFRITEEMQEDGYAMKIHKQMVDTARLVNIRADVSMGMGLSHQDAKFLFSQHDAEAEQRRKLQAEKPPPTIVHTLRTWLAAKISPDRKNSSEYDY